MIPNIVVEEKESDQPFSACGEYNRRLNRMEDNIAKAVKKGATDFQVNRWYGEARHVFTNDQRDEKTYNKLTKDLCVIVPSHRHQRPWIRACMQGVSKLGFFSILAYDNPYKPSMMKMNPATLLPPNDVMTLFDHISLKPKTFHSGVTIPHLWNMLFAVNQAYVLGFDYIFCINGDFIMEKPGNFPKIRELMGDADIFPIMWNPNRSMCGTAAFIAKTEPQLLFWRDFAKNLMKPQGNAEARMGRYYKDNGLKVFHDNPGPLAHQMPQPKSTWYKLLGLRHLHAEHKVRRWEKRDPVEEKYFDKRYFIGNEKNTLGKYWETGKKEFLEKWWSIPRRRG